MNKLMRNWLLVFPLVISACTSPNAMIPGPLFASNFPPPGPPNYQQGILDGCASAVSAIGNSAYSLIYNGVHYDVDKALNDQVYYRAWKDGYFYCKYEHDKGPE